MLCVGRTGPLRGVSSPQEGDFDETVVGHSDGGERAVGEVYAGRVGYVASAAVFAAVVMVLVRGLRFGRALG